MNQYWIMTGNRPFECFVLATISDRKNYVTILSMITLWLGKRSFRRATIKMKPFQRIKDSMECVRRPATALTFTRAQTRLWTGLEMNGSSSKINNRNTNINNQQPTTIPMQVRESRRTSTIRTEWMVVRSWSFFERSHRPRRINIDMWWYFDGWIMNIAMSRRKWLINQARLWRWFRLWCEPSDLNCSHHWILNGNFSDDYFYWTLFESP